MNSINFQTWKEQNPLLFNKYIFATEGKNGRWGRLLCTYEEENRLYTYKDDTNTNKKIKHIVCPLIDLSDDERGGSVYLDCSKRKIFAKHLCLVPGRLWQGILKTAYHLCLPISIPIEILTTIKQEKERNARLIAKEKNSGVKSDTPLHDAKEITRRCLKNSVKSLADIVRTPVYGVAMSIVSLAAVCIAPFSPTKLYDLRTVSGDLENKLLWGATADTWELTPCFKPTTSIKKIISRGSSATNISDKTPFELGLEKLAASMVDFRRSSRVPFNDCGFLLGSNTPFVSRSYGDIEKLLAKP